MRFNIRLRSNRGLLLFLALYAIVLVFFLEAKPLTLDEIIDMIGVRNSSVRAVLDFAPRNAGGVPLGYLCDLAMIRLFGYSVFAVRLPSAVFSLIACVGVYALARGGGLRRPLWAVICYAAFPLQVRYAMLARPYAQAACWSVLATIVFLKLVNSRPGIGLAVLYSILVAGGLYAQPYSIFAPVAHLVWLASTRSPRQGDRPLVLAGGAVAAASIAFLPWFFRAHAVWREAIGSGMFFAMTYKSLLLIAHELPGAGYLGFGLTLIGALLGLRLSPLLSAGQKLFWGLYIVVPLSCVLAADAYFGYFLAIRQFIFILVPLAVLIAMAAETLMNAGRLRWGLLAPGCLLAAMLYQNVHSMARPGEGWQAAASALSRQASAPGACNLFIPPDSLVLYAFFQSQLPQTVCDSYRLSASDTIAVAIRSNGMEASYSEAKQRLNRAGFSKAANLSVGEPRIELYRRVSGPPN
ncbi:MAG: glycosyltransferase family 39 protein [Bryobacteraceae bacterium]|jgi:hypothetical protein